MRNKYLIYFIIMKETTQKIAFNVEQQSRNWRRYWENFTIHFRPLEIFGMKNKPTTEFIFRMISEELFVLHNFPSNNCFLLYNIMAIFRSWPWSNLPCEQRLLVRDMFLGMLSHISNHRTKIPFARGVEEIQTRSTSRRPCSDSIVNPVVSWHKVSKPMP